MRVVKKPRVFEAIRWWKDGDHPEVLPIGGEFDDYQPVKEGAKGLLRTNYSCLFVFPGDWIISDPMNGFTVCPNDAFTTLYQTV